MMDTVKLNERQLKLVKDIVSLGKGRLVYTRKELREMHKKLRGHVSSPYFITKNYKAKLTGSALRESPRGSYTLERFVKYAQAHNGWKTTQRKPKVMAA